VRELGFLLSKISSSSSSSSSTQPGQPQQRAAVQQQADVTLQPLMDFLDGRCALDMHRVLKTVQICFYRNFVKFPPILIIFNTKRWEKAKIMRDALIFYLIQPICHLFVKNYQNWL